MFWGPEKILAHFCFVPPSPSGGTPRKTSSAPVPGIFFYPAPDTTFMVNPTHFRLFGSTSIVRTSGAFLRGSCRTFQSRRTRPRDRNPPVRPRRMGFIGLERILPIVWYLQAPSRAPQR